MQFCMKIGFDKLKTYDGEFCGVFGGVSVELFQNKTKKK